MHSTLTTTTLTLSLLVAPGQAPGTAAQTAATSPHPPSARCHWRPEELPRSPDAVEGWYHRCPPSTRPEGATRS